MLTLFGYHGVGMRPTTLPAAPASNVTTATAFVPPSLTYRVRSSGDRARLFGLAPFGILFVPRRANGAVTPKVARTRLVSVAITATASALSNATNNRS